MVLGLGKVTAQPTPEKEVDDGTVFQIKDGKTTYWAPGDYIRPCGSMETLTAVGGMYKNLNTVQAIWLQSKIPIEVEQVREALHILTRQVSLLQFCVAKRGYRLWFRRMKRLIVDFGSSTDEVMPVYEQMIATCYNMSTGPLWRAKLVFPNANDQCVDRSGFIAILIFSVHHCLTDGTTNMMLCRETVRILNTMAAGKQVVPKSIPISPIIDDTIKTPSLKFAAKYAGKKISSTLLKDFSKKSSFNGRFPIPQNKSAVTRVLFDSITTDETKNLIKQCKAEGVTVHACIVTASNFALLKTAQTKNQAAIGKCSIKVCHCVNVRRYLDENSKDAAGCHFSVMEHKSKLDLSDYQNFWHLSKDVHNIFKTLLEVDNEPAKLVPLLQYASLIIPANDFLTKKGYKNKTDCHYLTTNMGNLKDMLPEATREDAIEIVDILRSVSMLYMSNPFLLAFHTFRDSFKISMDYYSNKMTDDIAKEYFSNLCDNIRNLASHGSIY